MDFEEFRRVGKEMIDYITDYSKNVRDYNVIPKVDPGFLIGQLPSEAPVDGEEWTDIFDDIKNIIVPGFLQWKSPRFHAYICVGHSLTSVLGELLTAGFNNIEVNWASSPSSTELNMVVTDWLGHMVGLPRHFLYCSKGYGGGRVQYSSSSSFVLVMLAAQARLKHKLVQRGHKKEDVATRLVCYMSDEANLSVEKAALMADMVVKKLETDQDMSLRGHSLQEAIDKDKKDGLIPCFVMATVGTTSTCGVDNVAEIGRICTQEDLWLHVDAAYVGSACVCPEYRYVFDGIGHATSLSLNPHKWLLCSLGTSVLWIKDRRLLEDPFHVQEMYIRESMMQQIADHEGGDHSVNTESEPLHSHAGVDTKDEKNPEPDRSQRILSGCERENIQRKKPDKIQEYNTESGIMIPDYMTWATGLVQKSTALKLWLVIRKYGLSGIQAQIKQHVALAQQLEKKILQDGRFEIVAKVVFGLVCFRLKGPNVLSKKLFEKIRDQGKIFLSCSAKTRGSSETYFLRCAMVSEYLTPEDIDFTFQIIKAAADFILEEDREKA